VVFKLNIHQSYLETIQSEIAELLPRISDSEFWGVIRNCVSSKFLSDADAASPTMVLLKPASI
jgi:hypothetical protein